MFRSIPGRITYFLDCLIPVKDNENARQTHGTTMDLLNSFNSPDGKILNALDFPKYSIGHPSRSVASDIVAFRMLACPDYLIRDMRWGIAATEGAFLSFHINSNRLATYISCVNKRGSKWWVVLGLKDKTNVSGLASIKKAFGFHDGDGVDMTVLGDIQVEVVLLTPGTILLVLF
jgi:hypothetical protein